MLVQNALGFKSLCTRMMYGCAGCRERGGNPGVIYILGYRFGE